MPLIADAPLGAVAEVLQGLLRLRATASSDKRLEAWCDATIYHAVRRLEEFVEPEISVAAADLAKEYGCDLRTIRRPKGSSPYESNSEPGTKTRAFQWEHVRSIKTTIDLLRELKPHFELALIVAELERAEIAWITRDEDRRLNKGGFRWKRDPDDLWKSYRDHGIVIVGKEQETGPAHQSRYLVAS
jgi:hypothetical protein